MNPQMRELDEHATETATFVETALKLGGASEEEAKKTGALDRADQQIEDLFAPKYQTAGSPAHRAVSGIRNSRSTSLSAMRSPRRRRPRR